MAMLNVDEALRSAVTHHQAGRLAEAAGIYRQILGAQPGHPDALHLLGVLAGQSGNSEEAIRLIQQAVQAKPDFAEAYVNLGCTLANTGKLDKAVAALSRAVELKPQQAEASIYLAEVLKNSGRIEQAIVTYRRAIQINPQAPGAQVGLGDVLAGKGQYTEAVDAYRSALKLKPELVDAHNKMGTALSQLRRIEEAEAAHRRALKIDPNNASSHEALAYTLSSGGKMSEAVVSFRNALALNPHLALAWNGLGIALRSLGEFEEATKCFRRALDIRPDLGSAYANLAGAGRNTVDFEEVKRVVELPQRPDQLVEERIAALFALGKLLDDADRFDQAFVAYAEANSLAKERKATAGEHFSAADFRKQVSQIIEEYNSQFFGDKSGWGDASELPVFIVGMPRSGTTLVEQIAASHPQVFGAGELREIGDISTELLGRGLGTKSESWNPNTIRQAANKHVAKLKAMGGTALRVVDKMMGNIIDLGLISVMFPSARIIFCQRDPRDVCLSCYFQNFSAGNAFAYDLADCGLRHMEIERLAVHWRNVLPTRMLDVCYESLVADPVGHSRRIIDFLGLPWDDACLDFHKTKRAVLTASAWQVRQPIYSRSVGRWRHYERHLGPLLRSLQTQQIT